MPQLCRKHQPMPGNEAARKSCKMLVVVSFYGGRFSLLHSSFLLSSPHPPPPGFTLKWKTMNATPHLQVWYLGISTGLLLPDTWDVSLGVEHPRDLESCYGLKLTSLPRFMHWSPAPLHPGPQKMTLFVNRDIADIRPPAPIRLVSL